MALSRFYTDLNNLRTDLKIRLDESESLHLTKTLRKRPGDLIEVFNQESAFVAEVVSVERRSVQVKLREKLPVAQLKPVTLYIGLIKPSRFELVVQKTAELGVASIVPVICDYSNVLPNIYEKRVGRYQKIALEACKQSKNIAVPTIESPIDFSEIVAAATNTLFFTTEQPGNRLSEINIAGHESLNYIIGPEGGFSDNEVKLAQQRKWQFITFSPFIMRSETAALAGLAVIQERVNSF